MRSAVVAAVIGVWPSLAYSLTFTCKVLDACRAEHTVSVCKSIEDLDVVLSLSRHGKGKEALEYSHSNGCEFIDEGAVAYLVGHQGDYLRIKLPGRAMSYWATIALFSRD